MKTIDYHGWKALEIESGKARLTVPLDIGPRVLACRLGDGANLFHNVNEELGGTDEPEWKLRGGHRLWTSPEHAVRTYDPDNQPVTVETPDARCWAFQAPVDERTGIRKSMTIRSLGKGSFHLRHTLANEGLWPVETAPWALTVMERGGLGALPLPPRGSHPHDLLPIYSLVPWSYTDLSHPVWQFHKDFIGIDTTKSEPPQKLGITQYPGWSLYWQPGGTFVKYAAVDPAKTYPDLGCAYETFCNDFMLEMETLGPLETLEPGATVHHDEYWGVFGDWPKPSSDAVFSDAIKPAVDAWLAELKT
ncbi:MAG: hypothetical protein ACFE0O_12380 [Opitutales bacterium]